MSDRAIKRVQKELRDLNKCRETEGLQMKVDPKEDNFLELTGEIMGPPDTPYEGATFILDIKLPQNYPMSPPAICFVTKIWHPNIDSEDGGICLDILKNRWAATLTLRTVLLSIQLLLSSPRGKHALDEDVGYQYTSSRELFKRTARHWANVYAGGPNREIEFEEMIEQLKNLGHDEVKARRTLSITSWSVKEADARIQKKKSDGDDDDNDGDDEDKASEEPLKS